MFFILKSLFYRPNSSCGKVMISQASVSHSVYRGLGYLWSHVSSGVGYLWSHVPSGVEYHRSQVPSWGKGIQGDW